MRCISSWLPPFLLYESATQESSQSPKCTTSFATELPSCLAFLWVHDAYTRCEHALELEPAPSPSRLRSMGQAVGFDP